MREGHERFPSSSHVTILKTVTSTPHTSSANGKSVENALPPTIRSRYMTIEADEPRSRPDMVTCFRRLYMHEQIKSASTTIQQTQDQYAIRTLHL